MSKLIDFANKAFLQSNVRISSLSDIQLLKEQHPNLENENRIYLVSNFIRAIAIKNLKHKYPIVVYVDMENENIISIFYEGAKNAGKYSYDDIKNLVLEGDSISTQTLLEMISNRLLPNTSPSLSDELFLSIIDFGYKSDVMCGVDIIKLIKETDSSNKRITIESNYPRFNDDVIGILKTIMRRYSIKESIPSDLLLSADKTWVFKAKHPDYKNNYIELEVRQAHRNVDRGFEFKVINPGFRRRIMDVDQLRFAA